MAEVARVVARLLERAQDERRERLASAARLRRRSAVDALADRAGERGRVGGRQCSSSGAGGVGTSRSASLREQEHDRLRVRPLVHAEQRLAPPRRRAARRRPRWRGSSAPRRARARAARPRARRPRRRPAVERERRPRGDSIRSAPRAKRRPAQLGREPLGEPQRLGDGGSTARAPARIASRLPVGEPRVAADHRAVEDAARPARAGSNGISTVTQRRSTCGRRLQRSSESSRRQHRRDAARARRPRSRAAARRGRAASRRGRTRTRRRCAPRRGGRRPRARTEIASSKSFAVSGSIVNVTRSRRSTRPSSGGAGGSYGSNGRRRPSLLDEQPSSTASIRSAGPSTRSTRARPRPARTTARSPGCAAAEPLAVEHDRRPRREERLADDELAAPRSRRRRARSYRQCLR